MTNEDLSITEMKLGPGSGHRPGFRPKQGQAVLSRKIKVPLPRNENPHLVPVHRHQLDGSRVPVPCHEDEQRVGEGGATESQDKSKGQCVSNHLWKIGRYRFGIWRMIKAMDEAYAPPTWWSSHPPLLD